MSDTLERIEHLKIFVKQAVEDSQGIKYIELASKVAKEMFTNPNLAGIRADDLVKLLSDILESGGYKQVSYVLSAMPYRVKVFVLPPDTNVWLSDTSNK